jgi:aminopeptidase N
VLKQLVAFVGEDVFVSALQRYFGKHAWGNTTLDDLVAEVAVASGRDLTPWVEGWLETAGTDRVALEREDGAAVLVVTPPPGRAPLPHRLLIGAYADRGSGMAQLDLVPVEVAGERTRVDVDPAAELLLVNDEDLTFATVRPDPVSLELMLSRGGELPTAVGRTLALTTAWRLLYDGDLSARQLVDCGIGILGRETTESVVEPLLGRLVEAADHWAPPAERNELLSRVAELCVTLVESDARRVAAVRALAQSATTPEQLAALAAHATDHDLTWRRLTRLAELGRLEQGEVDALLADDPDPDAWLNAVRVRAAVPAAEAKAQAWQTVVVDRRVPPDVLGRVGRAFWRPGQDELLTPYAERFLTSLGEISDTGMLWELALSAGFYPSVGGEDGFVERLEAAAGHEGVSPVVRQQVRERNERRRRREAARAGIREGFHKV